MNPSAQSRRTQPACPSAALSDAIADGDTVYAVLLGGAIHNDGASRASFTAPNPAGQAAVIAMAHDAADVDARTIGYVEAHGTATPIGDPIEIEGLTRAFRRHTEDRGFCAIGSVKSNVGHLVTAAGAAGLINLYLIARHLERIGDRSCNIGEEVIYLVEGEIVRTSEDAV